MALDRLFDFGKAQTRWNAEWDRSGAFTPDVSSSKKPFVIVLPPPNVTGVLHVGHVLGDSVQDLLIRWRRMQGYNALYVPGSDHAGIATQKVVEIDLETRGIEKADLNREEFLKHAWEWKERHHKHIVAQMKKLGCSLDWTREAFTLDEPRSRAVRTVFVRLYEKGLIYRGDYIVNWCPECGTAISDEEVRYREKDAKLYWIRYPMRDGGHVTVATTRPETMLGDTAVAVSPQDETKKPLVGKTAVLPIIGRELPIIEDPVVDPEFGSGFVKVTPAHDPNDFDIGQRHDLSRVVVIDREAKMTEAAGEMFAGLDRWECRQKLLEELEKQDLVEKIEPYRHAVGEHDRCDTIIEPLLSREWFVRMEPLARPAIEVVEAGEIDFYPPRWRNVYLSWMNNIRDWCISRQLWWGHRIPVWYCPDGHLTVSLDDPTECGTCGCADLTQDENVLDTWFSSWLWTFSPLGWPDKTKDLEAFHPTSVLVTGSEIIFFWVARMIMAALEFMNEIPFRDVFLTGIVRDTEGRKMSKSLGNSPDPLDLIENYGTDALRFTLVMLSPPGRDVIFAEEKLETGRNFVNKLWQASRLVLGAYEKEGVDLSGEKGAVDHRFAVAWEGLYEGSGLGFEPDFTWEDRWILSALENCIEDMDEKLTGWRLNEAASRVYDFFWSDFCDWYLELAKNRLYGDGDKRTVFAVLLYTLGQSIKILHPFVPYVTEELWSELPMSRGLILQSPYPAGNELLIDRDAENRMELFRGLVTSARNIRAQYRVKPSASIELGVKTPGDDGGELDEMLEGLKLLTRAGRLRYGPNVEKGKGSASSPVGEFEVIVPLTGVADLEAEIERLRKERDKIQSELGVVEKKLGNEQFMKKARKEVVEKAESKRELLATELAKIEESLNIIGEDL
ncbi:MAG: valine--tRNA ligase [Candidatus Latescibacterota bacterium]|nr:MAG: valine--tRNA ligase [Candidatus Latescibacterota bacterium]